MDYTCECWKKMVKNAWDDSVLICADCDKCKYTIPDKYNFIEKIDKTKRYMFIDKKDQLNNEQYKTIDGNYVSYPTVWYIMSFHSNFPSISWKDIAYRSIDPNWCKGSWWRSFCEVDLIEIDEWDIPKFNL